MRLLSRESAYTNSSSMYRRSPSLKFLISKHLRLVSCLYTGQKSVLANAVQAVRYLPPANRCTISKNSPEQRQGNTLMRISRTSASGLFKELLLSLRALLSQESTADNAGIVSERSYDYLCIAAQHPCVYFL